MNTLEHGLSTVFQDIISVSFQIADPICSIFIALMIFMSVVPLVKETSLILLLRTPESHSESLSIALRKVGLSFLKSINICIRICIEIYLLTLL